MNADAEFLRRLATAKQEIADGAPLMLKTIFSTEAERLNHCADVIDRASAIPPREPTEKMIEAGSDVLLRQDNVFAVFTRDMADAWRAMYDAAIAEKEGK